MVTNTIKFLCSYAGRIVPRYPEGKLRYLGGETRVLSVDRSIRFSELLLKLVELCGTPASTLRCPLPTGDLDTLVSISSDEDLANVIEEYDRASPPPTSLKIRAFLAPPKSAGKISPARSSATAATYTAGGPTPRFSEMSAADRSHTPRIFMSGNKYLVQGGNYRYSAQRNYTCFENFKLEPNRSVM